MTKTLNQIILFFLHQNQNIIFSNNGNQNIFLEKNHNPTPFKLNGRSLMDSVPLYPAESRRPNTTIGRHQTSLSTDKDKKVEILVQSNLSMQSPVSCSHLY